MEIVKTKINKYFTNYSFFVVHDFGASFLIVALHLMNNNNNVYERSGCYVVDDWKKGISGTNKQGFKTAKVQNIRIIQNIWINLNVNAVRNQYLYSNF